MRVRRRRLGDILLQEGLITERELGEALEEQRRTGDRLGEILVKRGLITFQQLGKALEKQLGIPYVNLSEVEIHPQVARLIPEELARRYTCIPVKIENNWLYVAFSPPISLKTVEEIKLRTGLRIRPMIATRTEILKAINHYFSVDQAAKQAIADIRFHELAPSGEEEELEALVKLGEDPVIELVDYIIQGAINAGASDIHFEPQYPEMRVRYRIDGVLHDVTVIPKYVEQAVISRIKVMADMDIAEKRRPQDGHISIEKDGRELDIRVSTVLTVNGEKVVMRILDKEALKMELEEIGLSEEDERRVKSLIARPHGMLLVTGPTGSGKTTTLYSILRKFDSKELNIITIEDPVEYKLDGVNQIQVNPAIDMTFAKALRTILRQDPDIIMVGEIRDVETADIAIQAALTGHKVLSTVHTNDAPSAIVRLMDMGVEPYLIAASVNGVISQRLVRVICPECKEEYVPSEEEIAKLGIEPKRAAEIRLFRGKGCRFCFHTGYKGRTGIFEVMEISERIRRLIVERASTDEIREAAVEEGMRTLRQDAVAKVLKGITTVEEIDRVIFAEG
ncbi:hypothetical protein DRP77_05995 [Candidatus Poribacteria bacterium]|nr:MAG: hypothetical protein DRP77_05995 [Candidatus Poribacteria bacterium]